MSEEKINLAKLKAEEMIKAVLPFVNDFNIDAKGNSIQQTGTSEGRAKQICLLAAFELGSSIERITPKQVNFDTEAMIAKCKKELEFIEELKEEIEKYDGKNN